MSKKIVFGLILVLIVILGGGVFLWLTIPEQEIKGSPEDYQILETAEGKFIENKKAGLTVKVPEDWLVEKIEVMEGSVVLYSPDAEGVRPSSSVRPPLKKGCLIETAVVYKNMNFDKIEEEVREIHEGLIIEFDEFEIVTINDTKALRNKFKSKDLGYGDVVYIPHENQLYSFAIYAEYTEESKNGECSGKLDNFLETVSIQ